MNRMSYVALAKCQSCEHHVSIIEDKKMVRCSRVAGCVVVTHIMPSHYNPGLKNGEPCVVCHKEGSHVEI